MNNEFVCSCRPSGYKSPQNGVASRMQLTYKMHKVDFFHFMPPVDYLVGFLVVWVNFILFNLGRVVSVI